LGLLAARLGDHETCAGELAAARPAFSDDRELLLALGTAAIELGRFDAAIDPLEQLVKLYPGHPTASALLGRAYGREKRWNEASEALGRAIIADQRNLD